MKLEDLTEDGKLELALMILLWKDFKSEGIFDAEISASSFRFAEMLGVSKELRELTSKLPPMKIEPRYK